MSIQSCGGAQSAAEEIRALIDRLAQSGDDPATIIAKVKKRIEEIIESCESGWY